MPIVQRWLGTDGNYFFQWDTEWVLSILCPDGKLISLTHENGPLPETLDQSSFRNLTVVVAGNEVNFSTDENAEIGAMIYYLRRVIEMPDYGPMEYRDKEGKLITHETLVRNVPDFMYLSNRAGVGG